LLWFWKRRNIWWESAEQLTSWILRPSNIYRDTRWLIEVNEWDVIEDYASSRRAFLAEPYFGFYEYSCMGKKHSNPGLLCHPIYLLPRLITRVVRFASANAHIDG
jgi:hypothetical protein